MHPKVLRVVAKLFGASCIRPTTPEAFGKGWPSKLFISAIPRTFLSVSNAPPHCVKCVSGETKKVTGTPTTRNRGTAKSESIVYEGLLRVGWGKVGRCRIGCVLSRCIVCCLPGRPTSLSKSEEEDSDCHRKRETRRVIPRDNIHLGVACVLQLKRTRGLRSSVDSKSF